MCMHVSAIYSASILLHVGTVQVGVYNALVICVQDMYKHMYTHVQKLVTNNKTRSWNGTHLGL